MPDTQEKARILICDDEVIIAADLKSRLQKLGYSICAEATNGETALELIEQYQPDLVMMDIVLQGEMDGIDAAEVIRDKWGIPVVFLTAYADTDRLERAKLTYPFGYLLKPFQDRDLKITTKMALYVAKVDAKRRIAQKQLKLFMDNLPGVAFIKDDRGKLIYSNDMYYEVAGLKREDIAGKTYAEYLPPDIADVFRKEDDLIISKNEGIETESIFHTIDGDTYWLTKKFPIEGYKHEIVVGGISIDTTESKKAEKELQLTLDATTDGIWSWNFKTNELSFSPKYYTMLGYEPDEFPATYESWVSLIHPDDLSPALAVAEEYLKTKPDNYQNDFRIRTKDGEYLWVSAKAKVVERDENGEAVRMIGCHQDITKRKNAEKDAIEANEKYKRLYNNSPFLMAEVEAENYEILTCNKAMADRFGVKPGDIEGRNLEEVLPDDIFKTRKAWGLKALENNEVQHFVDERDGHIFQNIFIPVQYPNRRTVQTITIDITDRKQMEVELKGRVRFQKTLVNSIPAPVFYKDNKGKYLGCNREFELFFGKYEQEIVGKSVFDINPIELASIYHSKDVEVFTTGETQQYESQVQSHDGALRDVVFHKAPFYNEEGKVQGLIGAILDITDRKQTEEVLKQYDWITEKGLVESVIVKSNEPPRYGDVTEYNTNRVILGSVGKKQLADMAADVMALLDTSLAVYESNGDYAYGVFESGWCQTMDYASFRLCNMDDTQKALSCGKWLCHENCWNDSAKAAIESGRPTDIECVGGIHLYGVPIFAGDEVIGAVNIGYGNPPKDKEALRSLANKFNIDLEVIKSKAFDYKPRPEFIIEIGKRRCSHMAQMIGNIVERRRIENAAVEERDRMGTILANLQTGLSVINPDMTIAWVNQKIRDMFPEGNPIGQICHKFYENRDHLCEECGTHPAFEDGQTHIIERYNPSDNRWYHILSQPIKDENGQVLQVIEAVTDISERKQTEESLRKSEAKYRRLTENANAVIYRMSVPDGTYEYVSSASEKLLGYPAEEFYNKTNLIQEIIHPDWLGYFENQWENLVKGIMPEQYEYQIVSKSGETKWINQRNVLIRDNSGESIAIEGIVTDITDRKNTEMKIEQTLRRLEEAQQIAGIGDWDWDPQTNVVTWSKNLYSLFGIDSNQPPPDYQGQLDLYHLEDAVRLEEAVTQTVEHGTPYELEMRRTNPDGQQIYLTVRGVADKDKDEKIARLYGSVHDITDRKQAELEREKMITELQDAVAEIKELRGFLPICASCKKIRDDEGYWQQVEKYIEDRTHAQFSHSICPDCAKKLYPDFYED